MSESIKGHEALPRTLKRTSRIELPKLPVSERSPPQRKGASSSNQTRRKPTLIRNLGGSNAFKSVPHSFIIFRASANREL